jgi:hypothetical protein
MRRRRDTKDEDFIGREEWTAKLERVVGERETQQVATFFTFFFLSSRRRIKPPALPWW